MSGWIKLHRSMLEWEWFKDYKTAHLFNYCLMKANFKDAKFQGKVIPAGSFVSGRKVMAIETGMSEQEVRTSLTKLRATSNLTIKSTSKYSIISITNWQKYQDDQPTNALPINQPSTTIEERKKEKEEIKDIFAIWYSAYPHKVGRADAEKAFAKAIKKADLETLQAGLEKYKATKPHDRAWCNPATWLNQERWLDDPADKRGDGLSFLEELRRDSIHL